MQSFSAQELLELQKQIEALGPAATFPWHAGQQIALRAATDKIIVCGGNRSGKSKVGEGIVSRLVRREGPIYARLRWTEEQKLAGKRPLTIWVAPQTDEKVKSLWAPRLARMFDGMQYRGGPVREVQTPHHYFEWEDELGGGRVWLKSQEQGHLAFESNEVDLVLFDEEPEDKRVVTSAQMRLATTNGVIVFTYTPVLGMTWTYDDLYVPVKRPEYQIADRAWRKGDEITLVQFGMADNPEAADAVEKIRNDPSITEAEKAARLYGEYGYTEGLLLPSLAGVRLSEPSPYVITERDFRKHILKRSLLWFLLADPNKRHGALLVAFDAEGNRYYAMEHFQVGIADSQHAEGYRDMLRYYRVREDEVSAYADPGGAGAQAIINLMEVGFFAQPVPKDAGSVSASIKRLRRAAFLDPSHRHPITGASPAPHMYFIDSLESEWREGGSVYRESRLLWEMRQYRQKDKAPVDTPIKKNDDLVDCARYFELVHATEPIEVKENPILVERRKLDPASRRAHEDFDRAIEKLTKAGKYASLAL